MKYVWKLCAFLLSLGLLFAPPNGLAWARNHQPTPPKQFYAQPLTEPAQIRAKPGETEIEATISVDYNIPNNAGYQPQNTSANPRSQIGPDVVSLRNYTLQNIAQGEFTASQSRNTPQLNKQATWVTDIIGPTLRVKPGDSIKLHLINNQPNDREAGYDQWLKRGYRISQKNHPKITYAKYKQTHTLKDYFDEGNVSCIGNPLISNASCNMTNFHTHGLHDSPTSEPKTKAELAALEKSLGGPVPDERKYWISDDVIDSLLPGGNQWDIKIHIPENHPAGTFWYHPHQHGTTSVDLASGLEGAIIIDDIAAEVSNSNPDREAHGSSDAKVKSLDAILAEKGIGDRLLMFQHIPYESTNGVNPCQPNTPCEVGWTENGAQDANFAGQTFTGYTLINGQPYPLIEMAPGQIERWRLVHGGVAEPLSLSVVQLSEKGINSLLKPLPSGQPNILDGLVQPNRLPFSTQTNGTQMVIGTGSTPADKWLADTTNFTPSSGATGINSLPLNLIAYDGITTGKIDRHPTCPGVGGSSYDNCVSLSPGNRVDALMQFPTEGTYLILKSPNHQYLSNAVAASAEDIAAIVTVKGKKVNTSLPSEPELLAYANQQYYPPTPAMATATPDANYEGHFVFFPVPILKNDLGPAPTNLDETRDINNIDFGFAFSCIDQKNGDHQWCQASDFASASELGFDTPEQGLDYELFTEDMRPIVLTERDLGEWTIKIEDNGTITSAHPFHIHTNPFYIKEVKTCQKQVTNGKQTGQYKTDYSNCTSEYPNRWQDTLILQSNQIATFRYQPLDFDGSFVFHCHFVDHEDNGMMRWLKVCKADDQHCIENEKYGLLDDFNSDNI